SSPARSRSTNGTPSLATRLMPTPSSTASFTTPTASISPAKASGANAPDRSQKIDHQPPTLAQIYYQQSARQPGDIISERRATSSRNQRATSSESAVLGELAGPAGCRCPRIFRLHAEQVAEHYTNLLDCL